MINLAKNETAKIDLTKHENVGEVAINLNWGRAKKGLFGGMFGGTKEVDLDLGCLYELADGSKSAVQALGKAFGTLNTAPFIALDGDDRTGDSKEGEWLRINGAQWSKIRRVLVYAFIYEGVPNWKETNGVLTIHPKQGDPVQITLDGHGGEGGFCVGALLENDNGSVKITRVDRYFRGHKEADEAFHFGLRWQSGHK